jgi:hypothetical protein
MSGQSRTIPVHVLGDDRIHLAPPHYGRLRQGQLKTVCGLVAVTALSPFVMAEEDSKRCPVCFGTGKATPAGPKREARKPPTGSEGKARPAKRLSTRTRRKTPRRAV